MGVRNDCLNKLNIMVYCARGKNKFYGVCLI